MKLSVAVTLSSLILSTLACHDALAASSPRGSLIGAGTKGHLENIPSGFDALGAVAENKAGISAKFISLKPGEFMMGTIGEAPRGNDETQHPVRLTRGFEIQATEVTQLQYFLVMGRNPSTFTRKKHCDSGNFKLINGVSLCANHPVETITWEEVQQFIDRLNQAQDKYVYRLPTEAEREYAARGGMPSTFQHRYPIGAADAEKIGDFIWYDRNASGRTHSVATKKPNPYGLHDMAGNVCELTSDWYREYPRTAEVDPRSPEKSFRRIIRGGSWHRSKQYQRSGYRGPGFLPGALSTQVGFRLVRTGR